AQDVQPVSPFLLLGRPYPRGLECGLASCFVVEAVEAVPEQDVSGECYHDEEELSWTCGVSAGENENRSSEGVDFFPTLQFRDSVVATAR
ncbi:hypothetical protein A2U01_0081015, partial [Trifolium medium]|nr:hypothetical protein [Trifolium medium]